MHPCPAARPRRGARTLAAVGGVLLLAACVVIACRPGETAADASRRGKEHHTMTEKPNAARKVTKSEDEWRRTLTPEQFAVCRQKGTERAFTGKHWNNHETGMYRCAACGAPLFGSDTKFDSGTGWPSFWKPLDPAAVETAEDRSLLMRRTEVACAACGSHLGHVFDDGPAPTGERYCINSVCLDFAPQGDAASAKTGDGEER